MTQWEGKTRGGLAGYKIFVILLQKFGLRFSYFMLSIVSVYYLFSSRKAYRSVRFLYHDILGHSKIRTFFMIYMNFRTFGTIILDKIAVLSGIVKKYTYNFDGEEHLRGLNANKTGGILINTHMGNWEIAGQLLERLNSPINLLMFDAEHEHIKKYLSGVLVNKRISIIVIKDDISHLEAIKKALENKEIVAIAGDRFMDGNRTLKCDFLGREAKFPVSPFYIAAKFNVPVVYVFAMKESMTHYHFYASPPQWISNKGSIAKRNMALNTKINEFVKHVEVMVKKYPHQWFNYYSYWSE